MGGSQRFGVARKTICQSADPGDKIVLSSRRHAKPKLRPGGYLLVDDVNFWPSPAALPIPDGWAVVDDSTNGLKRCLIWRAT